MHELEMSELNNNNLNILDLPDEVLFIILNKLKKIDVLHSLVYVNNRFHRLALDSLYIRNLDMTDMTNINSFYDQMFSIDIQSLSRFSEKIVPKIHHQVHKLVVEQYSIKHILTRNYPQLNSLSLINFDEEILYQHLTDNLILRDLLTKQIVHLNIDMKEIREYLSKTVSNTFVLILSLCKKLIDLNFGDMFLTRKCLTAVFCLPLLESCMSSTLVKLKINVINIVDILLLLDGRLGSLSTLIITVSNIYDEIEYVYNGPRGKLSKLKCFSLTVLIHTHSFNSLIVPLLCRMINLEELQLYVHVRRFNSTYIDGIELFDEFLIYMTQLNKFTFSIKTMVCKLRNYLLEFPTNDNIQRSFIGRYDQQIASYVQTNSMKTKGKCHIYTVPYEFEYFHDLDNSFQRGTFRKVRYLKMNDIIPFEHKLFQVISEEFPFLQFLYISNSHPIQDKQSLFTLITFPYLTLLDLKCAHVEYAELFLLKKNLDLPCLLNLAVTYESLTMITNNFTNNPTHFNFQRLKSLDVCQSFVRPKNFHQYFPLL